MARKRANNPDILGQSIPDLGILGLGLAGTAWVNDSLLSPLARQFMPSMSGGVVGKVIEAATTVASAWLLGEGVGMLFGSHERNLVHQGGGALAVARAISIPIPNYGITAQLPLPSSFAFGAVSTKALAAGQAAAVQPAANPLDVGL